MAKHAFFIGAGGSGGGGSGSFAYITVKYPAGQVIECEFDGDVTEAPDTSGVWVYGCDEAGIYKFTIQGTTVSQTVEITTQGQLETIWVTPQVINYALIYYLGNEFADPTEEEKKYAIKTGGWAQQVVTNSTGIAKLYASTNINININQYNKCFYRFNITNANIGYAILTGVGTDRNSAKEGPLFDISYINYTTWSSSSSLLLSNEIVGENKLIACGFATGTDSRLYFNYGLTKETNALKLHLAHNNQSYYCDCYVYSVGFVKTDDLSGLSTYGSTITEILNNAVSLFDDPVALGWMVLNCTGDFMISALSNTNFINTMNTSANKNILIANEHWARFIALLSV